MALTRSRASGPPLSPLHRVARQVCRWCCLTEASTRTSAMLRILIVFVLWTRWGDELLMYHEATWGWRALTGSFFVFTSLMLVGLWSRLSGLIVAAIVGSLVFYRGVHLGHEPWTHHHTYFLAYATILIALAPIGRSLSVDRWLALKREQRGGPPAPPERANIWALRLLCLQVCTMYLWSAIDKTNAGFLSGTRMAGYFLEFYIIDYPGAWFDVLCLVLGVSTVVLEYALAVGLLFDRTRLFVMVPGIVMHGVFYALLPVKTFTATVWVAYLACLDPDAVERALARMLDKPSRASRASRLRGPARWSEPTHEIDLSANEPVVHASRPVA
ncbi:MAG: hypothetical protein B7733_13850 [Myxococcales bacterium FL481]|nr:MAG: hypothetical protein B7733_13850 [Myxococcales bacterium FL481]